MNWNFAVDNLYPEFINVSHDEYFLKIELHWHEGHGPGMTDDLGIIADRDQYVEEELPGWYGYIPPDMVDDVWRWCIDALENRCELIRGGMLRIPDDDDAAMFTLRWG